MKSRSDPEKHRSYFIRTFGCQMNFHDSEHVAGVLEESGYEPAADLPGADIVIFNTCCVRESAENRVWGNLSRIRRSDNGTAVVAVCGCMAELHGIGIIERFPVVNLVFGLDSLTRLPSLLERCRDRAVCDLGDRDESNVDRLPSRNSSRLKAWIPVSHGCNNSCSYCIVPRVRGAERSRHPREVIEEVERLASRGVVEVTLLGQNVNSYGRDRGFGVSFGDLLRKVSSVSGIRRVKFETSHPGDLSDDVIEAISNCGPVCEHLHLPVQSGSDRILEAMGRGYDSDYYLELIEKARKAVPDLAVTTDVIVGFPSETEEDFQQTLDLVGEVGFEQVYMFIYSKREGTPAAELPDEVTQQVKRERLERLNRLQERITSDSMERLIGSSVELLVEGRAKNGNMVRGRSRRHQVVLLPEKNAPVDSLVQANVESAGKRTARGAVEKIMVQAFDGKGVRP